jgi:hypothetical protein
MTGTVPRGYSVRIVEAGSMVAARIAGRRLPASVMRSTSAAAPA